MQPKLLVLRGPDQGRTFFLIPGTLYAGRGQNAAILLNDPRASRAHCKFEVTDNAVAVVDENSTAGTLVNGARVRRQVLQPGDTVQIGDTVLRFVRGDIGAQDTIYPVPPVAASSSPSIPRLPPERMHELTGVTLSHFEIGPLLGRGQSGLVFLARDTDDGKTVALKVLWPEFAEDEQEVQRFIRAMKTMLPMKHPHLVTIHAAGKTGPYCWVSMELVEGESVTKILQMLGQVGSVDWKPALRVAIHVARALVFAHHHHIIHRNIAPQNILVRASDQTVKLGDLMLAKALEGSKAQEVTRPGELLGDVRFMAPERTYGDRREDLRADVYSLGATVYAMVTGRAPHEGRHPLEILAKVRTEEPVRPRIFRPNLPELFEGTLLKMLAKRPEARHQTAIELLADLNRTAQLQGVPV